MDDFTKRILEDAADIQAHGPYQVTISCEACGRKATTTISKEDWLKPTSDAPTKGRTKMLTGKTCPQCAPDEFASFEPGED